MSSSDSDLLDRFREAIVDRLGLLFDEGKSELLASVLERRARATGLDPEAYVAKLGSAGDAELALLAPDLTVGETYFFRHAEQLRAFVEIAQSHPGTAPLRVVSLGCASGEEPYTLAMLMREFCASREVSIRAIDIHAELVEKARRGRYAAWSLRETTDYTRARWFQTSGAQHELDPSIREMVRFDVGNLARANAPIFSEGPYDIVFCRNVMMYFAPDRARALIARIAAILRESGALFLGHAETLRGISNDFHLRHVHGAFYYERKEEQATASRDRADARDEEERSSEGDTSWVSTIHQAADRVTVLAERSKRARGPASAKERGAVALAHAHLEAERFGDALDALARAEPSARRDPDVVLLRAVLLAQRGQLVEAERVCTALLAIDELNAGAHYLIALAREDAGDPNGAREHDLIAVYLDPAFAMPHLHMGLIARRAGDLGAAQRELSVAIELLAREDASRVLLFGGGFSRDALLALCRAELRGCTP